MEYGNGLTHAHVSFLRVIGKISCVLSSKESSLWGVTSSSKGGG